jgi:hypothetical protein
VAWASVPALEFVFSFLQARAVSARTAKWLAYPLNQAVSKRSRSYLQEWACENFSDPAKAEQNTKVSLGAKRLLQSMSRFFKFLPGEQRRAFLHKVAGKAS